MFLLRVLMVSHEMTYTGAPKSLLNIAILLRLHGAIVKVATLERGEFEKEYLKNGFIVRHYDQEIYPYQMLGKKYDLVIANTIFCGKFALNSQKYVPTILYIRESYNLPDIIRDCNLSDDYINNAQNIICVSEYAEEFILRNYSVNNLYVLHNFFRYNRFHKSKPNISPDGIIRFLIVGTIEERKGIEVVLKAMEMLPKELFDKIELHITGRMVEWAYEYQQSLRLEEKINVFYHGETTRMLELNRLYDSVNVVIVPSYDESCSLVALEGAMHGRVLVLSENVGAGYIVDNNGYIFKTGSAEDLTSVISRIINNPQRLKEMGEVSEKNFRKYVSEKEYYENFNKIISEVMR